MIRGLSSVSVVGTFFDNESCFVLVSRRIRRTTTVDYNGRVSSLDWKSRKVVDIKVIFADPCELIRQFFVINVPWLI